MLEWYTYGQVQLTHSWRRNKQGGRVGPGKSSLHFPSLVQPFICLFMLLSKCLVRKSFLSRGERILGRSFWRAEGHSWNKSGISPWLCFFPYSGTSPDKHSPLLLMPTLPQPQIALCVSAMTWLSYHTPLPWEPRLRITFKPQLPCCGHKRCTWPQSPCRKGIMFLTPSCRRSRGKLATVQSLVGMRE